MNNKTLIFLLSTALIAAVAWGVHTKKNCVEIEAFKKEGICANGNFATTRTTLDTIDAHGMINTYQTFIDSLQSPTFIRSYLDSIESGGFMVGKGEYAAPFKDIFEQALGNTSFRAQYPCEFNDILADASTRESVYVVLAVRNMPDGTPFLDLIYKVKTDQPMSRTVDSNGYFYEDSHCPCAQPCCCTCPAQCTPTSHCAVNTSCTVCPQR